MKLLAVWGRRFPEHYPYEIPEEEVIAMACPERTRLTDWILEELSPAEAKEVEGHVERCTDCGRSVSALRQAIHLLKANLTDREMPARLVFLEEKPRRQTVPFLASLWQTAALAAVAAVVFLGVVLAGYSRLGNRPVPALHGASAGLTRPEVEALVRQEVAKGLEQQKLELRNADEQLAAGLERAQARNLALVAGKLEYLESAQKAVWKETQQQGAVVELIARNALGGQPAPSSKP